MASPAGRDPWLERWKPAMRAASPGGAVLELGCDAGWDTAWLAREGFRVTATDISAEALDRCRKEIPGATFVRHDLRAPMPFGDGEFGVSVSNAELTIDRYEMPKVVWETVLRKLGKR
jgi:SAM-dependent methyltransferase